MVNASVTIVSRNEVPVSNPNPRVMVNRCYAASVYYGDLVRLSTKEEFEQFHTGLVSVVQDYFGDRLLAVTVHPSAERIVFVFKKMADAQQFRRDWRNVATYLEMETKAREGL